MKFISATSILLISSSGFANATLPPGYEDNMHCPPGSCSLYIQHRPGFAGPQHAFYKCYDETTDKTTEAVWTGFRTQVEAPQGWIQDPEECDVASTPTPPNPHRNIDTPGGMCVNDSDCFTRIRSMVPQGAIGPGLCECYATSIRNPFDETEGSTNVAMARCDPSACDGFEPYCPLAPNDDGMAECALRPIGSSSSSSSDDSPRPPLPKRPSTSSSSSSDDTPRPPLPKRPTASSSTSSSSSDDTPRPPLPKRPSASSSTTSSSSNDSPRPPLPTKKIKPYQSSTSTTSDDSSSSNVIVSPTPAPPVKVVAEM
eukprot:scaffold2236_cov152-Skeletonema_menzelii.AAC.7